MASKIPGVWGESYVEGSEAIINGALDGTIGGTWYVLFGSTIAFIVSAIVNNYTIPCSGKISNNNSKLKSYAFRSYVSTGIGQLLRQSNVRIDCVTPILWMDIVTMCCVCLYGMIVETLCEVIFSYPGFRSLQNWKKNKLGREYFEYMKESSR